MNSRQLAILAVLAAVSVAATAAVLRTGTQTIAADRRGERVLPGLVDKANEISGLTVREGADTLTMERKDTGFVAADSGFPVKTAAVRDLVASAIDLSFEEARTSDPSRYADLKLADPGPADTAGTEIVFRSGTSEIADLVVGNRDNTVGGPAGGVFVRLKGQPQTWLARGNVRLPSAKSDWFTPIDLGIKRSDIKTIAVSGGGRDPVTVKAAADKPGEFTLESVPEKRVADTFKLGRLATLAESFAFKDVRKKSKAADDARHMTFDIGDGLRLVLTGVGDPAEGWVQVASQATNDTMRERAAAITGKVDGFEFLLPPNQAEILGWTATDLTNEEKS
jgi:hypothetical protein